MGRASSTSIGVILMVGVVLVAATAVTVSTFSFGQKLSGGEAPVAALDVEYERFSDGVDKNDAVILTHVSGDRLDRRQLEVTVGDDTVYNETDDSESNGGTVSGLQLEVDSDDFNDLNKPCRFKPGDCSPSDPPGDGDGADPSVTLQWEENVSAGQQVVIQERNNGTTYDVMQPGETITVSYRGDGFTTVIHRETVAPEAAA